MHFGHTVYALKTLSLNLLLICSLDHCLEAHGLLPTKMHDLDIRRIVS